ncbi:non-SERCA-type Ca2+-transporting P-ATPase, putative (ATP4), partial [Plasmodium ovale curtisi]
MSSERQSVTPNRANLKGEDNNNQNNQTNDVSNSPVNNNSNINENGKGTVEENKNGVNTNIQDTQTGEKADDKPSMAQKKGSAERRKPKPMIEKANTENLSDDKIRNENAKPDEGKEAEERQKLEKEKTERLEEGRRRAERERLEKSKSERLGVDKRREEREKFERSKTEKPAEEKYEIEKKKTEMNVSEKNEIEKKKTEMNVSEKNEIEKKKTEMNVSEKNEIEKKKTGTKVSEKKDGEDVANKGILVKAESKDANELNGEKENDEGYRNHYASESIENLCKEFDLTDINKGLTFEQVKINRERFGENFIEKDSVTPIWILFLSQYYSPVVMLLLVAAVASLALNEVVEGISIITIVTLNACLATYMEKSSGDAIAKLAEMASPQCTVLREGQKMIIPSREVVVGDVVLITAGDSISADLRLIEVIELKTNESLLTGESEDIKKTLVPSDYTTAFCTNLCFATTSVTNGCGKGIAISTGLNTQVGKIASQLKKSSEGSKLTPLQVSLNRLGGLIGLIEIARVIISI